MPERTQATVWPDGKTCAVSLTYDGALTEHIQLLPLLDKLELQATFFASPTRMLDDPQAWQKAAEIHEIGNHSLYGVADGGTLLNWSLEMIEADIASTNRFISQIIGQICNSFALPGWSTHCAEGDYLPLVHKLFPFVRSDRREINTWKDCDLGYVCSYPFDFSETSKLIEQASRKAGWVVFRGESISDTDKHERFIKSLASSREGIWIAPFGSVAARLSELRLGAQ